MPITPQELKIIDKILVERPKIVEVGSHHGDAIKQLFAIRPRANIDAYEADSENYAVLARDVGDVARCYLAAIVSDTCKGVVALYSSKKQSRCCSLYKSVMKYKDNKRYQKNTVSVINVGRVVYGCDLARFDCYGAEYNIFSNGTRCVNAVPVIMITLHAKPFPFNTPEYKHKRITLIAHLKKTHNCIYSVGGGTKHIKAIWQKK